MVPAIISVADTFVDCLSNAVKMNSEVELYDWLARFTADIIGTCVFGVDCNSLNDPIAEFCRMVRMDFDKKLLHITKLIMFNATILWIC